MSGITVSENTSSTEDNTGDLFSTLRLLSLLGQNQYEFAAPSSASRSDKRSLREILTAVALVLPAIIDGVFSLDHVGSILFSRIGELNCAYGGGGSDST